MTLSKRKNPGKGVNLKADRNVMHRQVCVYAFGREVNLSSIVQHELMYVPIFLAETNGSWRTGNKAILAECLTGTVDCPPSINIKSKASLLIGR